MAHTPGPWKNNGGQIEGPGGFPNVIATVGKVNQQTPLDTDNANLVASAPALLAACRRALETSRNLDGYFTPLEAIPSPLTQQLEAAIDAAEGK